MDESLIPPQKVSFVQQCIETLTNHRLVVLCGPSGCGKHAAILRFQRDHCTSADLRICTSSSGPTGIDTARMIVSIHPSAELTQSACEWAQATPQDCHIVLSLQEPPNNQMTSTLEASGFVILTGT